MGPLHTVPQAAPPAPSDRSDNPTTAGAVR
jgi:hypothetical protein